MEHYLVSICVPVYNVERYIERCAVSLFEQTYGDIEYVFVDDCGTDNSIAILNTVISRYEGRRVSVIHHKHNRGLAAARNSAVAAAKGDFVMHVDSDDWLELNAVETLVKRQIETGADLVSGNALVHYADHVENMVEPDYRSKAEILHSVIQLSLDHVIWRRLIRRSLYVDNGIEAVEGYDIGEDHYTLPRLVYYAKSFAKVDEAVYHYNRMNAQSCTYYSGSDKEMEITKSDINALNILSQFFEGKDDCLVDELKKIKKAYIEPKLHQSLVLNDWRAYQYYASSFEHSRFSDVLDWLMIVICKALHKVTGRQYERLM